MFESTVHAPIGAILNFLVSPKHIDRQMLFLGRKVAVAEEAAVVEVDFLVSPQAALCSNVKYALTFF